MQDFHSNRKDMRASQSHFSPIACPQCPRAYVCVLRAEKVKRMTTSVASQWCMVNIAVCGTLYEKDGHIAGVRFSQRTTQRTLCTTTRAQAVGSEYLW